jgi:hypothetical protein
VEKAIVRPSGENCGSMSVSVEERTFRGGAPPSAFQMSASQIMREYASRCPARDTVGPKAHAPASSRRAGPEAPETGTRHRLKPCAMSDAAA